MDTRELIADWTQSNEGRVDWKPTTGEGGEGLIGHKGADWTHRLIRSWWGFIPEANLVAQSSIGFCKRNDKKMSSQSPELELGPAGFSTQVRMVLLPDI